MILIKTEKEIEIMRQGGKKLARILEKITNEARPGVNIKDLDEWAEELILQEGGVPSFKGYKGRKSDPPFPSVMCISINEEVVHGNGRRDIVLQEGDIVDFDIGLRWPKDGLYTDMSKTIGVGKITPRAQRLLEVTEKSLEIGINQAWPGKTIADIGRAIQSFVEKAGFSVVRSLTGHGVGRQVHEAPFVPNYPEEKFGKIKIQEGMTLAIEPMVNEGTFEVKTEEDGWSVVTADKKLSAHFEHTIAITEKGPEILTKL